MVPLLALAPFFCVDAGPGWPSMIRDRFLLVLAWSAAGGLAWVGPGPRPLALVRRCRWRRREGVSAVVTVGAGIGLYLAARTLPVDLFPLVTWIIVLGVTGQVLLAMVQMGLAMGSGGAWRGGRGGGA